MATERPTQSFDLIRIHKGAINKDLGKINQTRRNGPNANLFSALLTKMGEETVMNRLLDHLEIVTDPHFILASRDEREFVVGDITSTHADLEREWNDKRDRAGLLEIRTHIRFVSGIGFRLKIDPLMEYIRLDVQSIDWEELPPYAITFIDAGYTVVDADYKRVDRDVDYGLIWHQRNDI